MGAAISQNCSLIQVNNLLKRIAPGGKCIAFPIGKIKQFKNKKPSIHTIWINFLPKENKSAFKRANESERAILDFQNKESSIHADSEKRVNQNNKK